MTNQRKKELTDQVVRKLIKMRKEKNLTQENVRFDLDINIGRIECGKHMPNLPTIDRLATYYGSQLCKFFEDIK